MSRTDRLSDLLSFIDRSPTAYHAVEQAVAVLEPAGFRRVVETDRWTEMSGGSFYLTRHGATVAAVVPGSRPPAETGCRIVVAHTDAPSLKIKFASESVKAGVARASVELYGGPIVNTWVDRPLSVAGVVIVETEGRAERRLYNAREPVAVIPNAAIHLNRDVNKGFELNAQEHLRPFFSVVGDGAKNGVSDLRAFVAEGLRVSADTVLDYDLFLYDPSPGLVIGTRKNLISSSRLDNLAMCHAILGALLGAGRAEQTNVAVLFDSEEIGSTTYQGAGSALLRDLIDRLVVSSGGDTEDCHRARSRSFLISGDAAHAVHPNYVDKHDEHYQPCINGGPVIKISAAQRYTSTAETSVFFERLCRANEIPVQKIISRSDMPSGGTIGPGTSTLLGIPSVDIGHPIWAMHSVRETGGTDDHGHVIEALSAFYQGWD